MCHQRFTVWLGVACTVLALGLPARADPEAVQRYAAYVVMDADSGQILAKRNADASWPPASVAKLMLLQVVRELVRDGDFALDEPIRASARESRTGGSQVYLKEGEVFKLSELLSAVEIASANDACVAIAEGLVGSVHAMVALMNDKAKALGMDQTYYVNVHGLPPESQRPDSFTTARDTAVLARHLIREFPDVLSAASTARAPFRNGKFTLYNTNQDLLRRFAGADGLKTGYHSSAGYNLVATAKRRDFRLISVVFGTPSERGRTDETIRVLSTAFATHRRRTVLKSGETLPDLVYVEGSQHVYTPLRVAGDLTVLARNSEFPRIRLVPEDVPKLEAPVRPGDPAGRIAAKLDGRELASVSLVVDQEVKGASALWRLWHWRTPRPTEGRFLNVREATARAPSSR